MQLITLITIDYGDATDYSRFLLMTILLKESLMLAQREGLHSLLLTIRIIKGMFLAKRCGSSVIAVISVISLSFCRMTRTIPSIIAVISVITVISLITMSCALMVITPIHACRGR